jgi:hypothetical protein
MKTKDGFIQGYRRPIAAFSEAISPRSEVCCLPALAPDAILASGGMTVGPLLQATRRCIFYAWTLHGTGEAKPSLPNCCTTTFGMLRSLRIPMRVLQEYHFEHNRSLRA